MSENSKKAARVNSLKKKLQVRRAATGGPKGDFYIIGGAVKDEYDGLFVEGCLPYGTTSCGPTQRGRIFRLI